MINDRFSLLQQWFSCLYYTDITPCEMCALEDQKKIAYLPNNTEASWVRKKNFKIQIMSLYVSIFIQYWLKTNFKFSRKKDRNKSVLCIMFYLKTRFSKQYVFVLLKKIWNNPLMHELWKPWSRFFLKCF